MKEFSCGSVVPACTARFVGETDDDILSQVAVHAQSDHGMDEVPAEVVEQVRANISEVPA